jgi:hypothetical protein
MTRESRLGFIFKAWSLARAAPGTSATTSFSMGQANKIAGARTAGD